MPPMPPIPPPPPIGGLGVSLGMSVTSTSAVVSRDATPAASCRAMRTTLVGSMIPKGGTRYMVMTDRQTAHCL